MKVKVSFGESIKDGKGDLHIYRAEVEKDIEETGLSPEQQLAKMRAVTHFLHNELHKAIQAQQVKDGVIETPTHQDAALG